MGIFIYFCVQMRCVSKKVSNVVYSSKNINMNILKTFLICSSLSFLWTANKACSHPIPFLSHTPSIIVLVVLNIACHSNGPIVEYSDNSPLSDRSWSSLWIYNYSAAYLFASTHAPKVRQLRHFAPRRQNIHCRGIKLFKQKFYFEYEMDSDTPTLPLRKPALSTSSSYSAFTHIALLLTSLSLL